jgi:hypothetical protein
MSGQPSANPVRERMTGRSAHHRAVCTPTKNLVTVASKARIVIVRPAGSDLIVATEAPAQSGLFCRRPQKSAPPKRGRGLAMMFARRDLPIPPQTSKSAISPFVPSDSRLVAAALSIWPCSPRISRPS